MYYQPPLSSLGTEHVDEASQVVPEQDSQFSLCETPGCTIIMLLAAQQKNVTSYRRSCFHGYTLHLFRTINVYIYIYMHVSLFCPSMGAQVSYPKAAYSTWKPCESIILPNTPKSVQICWTSTFYTFTTQPFQLEWNWNINRDVNTKVLQRLQGVGNKQVCPKKPISKDQLIASWMITLPSSQNGWMLYLKGMTLRLTRWWLLQRSNPCSRPRLLWGWFPIWWAWNIGKICRLGTLVGGKASTPRVDVATPKTTAHAPSPPIVAPATTGIEASIPSPQVAEGKPEAPVETVVAERGTSTVETPKWPQQPLSQPIPTSLRNKMLLKRKREGKKKRKYLDHRTINVFPLQYIMFQPNTKAPQNEIAYYIEEWYDASRDTCCYGLAVAKDHRWTSERQNVASKTCQLQAPGFIEWLEEV